MYKDLPAVFHKNVLEVYPLTGASWLRDLPDQVAKLCQLWDLRFVEPVTNLTFGFVAIVIHRASAEEMILKITPPDGPAMQESRWLNIFSDVAPKIYRTDETKNAFLMERMHPGTSLKHLFPDRDNESTKIITECIRAIQLQQLSRNQDTSQFKHLSTLGTSYKVLTGHFDDQILQTARHLFLTMTVPKASDVILHGDLHHDNILQNRDGWKVIDPHGYIGDPVFETAPMIYNPLESLGAHCADHLGLRALLKQRIQILSTELKFPSERVEKWAFCMTVLSIAWTFEGSGTIPDGESAIARILFESIP